MALLEIKDLKFTYAGAAEPSLSGISFSVDHGEAVLLCGPVGCGKSTLISCLLPGGNPRGTTDGTVSFSGHAVGYVSQSEQVSVTDRVFSELSFPLENLGLEPSTILRRVSELAAALGLEKLLDRRINTLSGGERRLVSLGAALITRPELLLLDEPTSQLDPVTAARFYDSLFRISRDNGIALFICEHRTEEVIALCDRVIMLKDGTVAQADSPRALSSVETDAQLRGFLPLSARIAARLGTKVDLPLTVSEGRKFLGKILKSRGACCENAELEPPKSTESALEMRDICFAYGRREPDVLCGLDLTLHEGEASACWAATARARAPLSLSRQVSRDPIRANAAFLKKIFPIIKTARFGKIAWPSCPKMSALSSSARRFARSFRASTPWSLWGLTFHIFTTATPTTFRAARLTCWPSRWL